MCLLPGVDVGEGNGLVNAVHVAYSLHCPLVLSPDVIWLTIAQGVAHHVRLHAEHLRERLVRFQGKHEIALDRQMHSSQLARADWAELIDEFASKASAQVDLTQLPQMLCTFSTTTAAGRVASQVVLLDGLRRARTRPKMSPRFAIPC